MTKTEKVKNHLEKFGNITSLEAFNNYGATRLSAIIYNLRNRGLNIRTERVEFTDKYGNKSYYGKYILEGGE
jgi:hypothetical protein